MLKYYVFEVSDNKEMWEERVDAISKWDAMEKIGLRLYRQNVSVLTMKLLYCSKIEREPDVRDASCEQSA